MTEIDTKQVEHYAKLANLSFDASELKTIAKQFGGILNYVEKISQVNLDHLPATTQIFPLPTPLRKDQAQDNFDSKKALLNAPDSESGHFLVPKVIDVK